MHSAMSMTRLRNHQAAPLEAGAYGKPVTSARFPCLAIPGAAGYGSAMAGALLAEARTASQTTPGISRSPCRGWPGLPSCRPGLSLSTPARA
jgi:hypothetical protein